MKKTLAYYIKLQGTDCGEYGFNGEQFTQKNTEWLLFATRQSACRYYNIIKDDFRIGSIFIECTLIERNKP